MIRQYIRVYLWLIIVSTMLSSHITAQTRRQSVDLLVLGGTIVTMDQTRRVIEDGGIAISQGRIVAIGPRADIERAYTSRQRVSAAGKVITPGLINGHTHVPTDHLGVCEGRYDCVRKPERRA